MKVVKRDGSIVDYNPDKIVSAIEKANKEVLPEERVVKKDIKKIINFIEKQNKKLDIHMCESFQESLELAKRIAKPGQVVLFSPASTSFDMFKDMYDRGNQFKEAVNKF